MEQINVVAQFIQESKVFYLATNGKNGPDVRPMGIVIPYNERLYFILAKPMNLNQQLQEDGKVSISTFNGEKMLRLYGTAVLDDSDETKDAFIDMNEQIAQMFPKEIIAPYFLKDVKASIGAMGGQADNYEF
ncbi:pyridoxamine 5'-phosphate oxidase family protein [Anaeromicrobium sediminis]|uniref:Pyridoxamine 5'-phosphate oxidase n=1 Tax=Anaeromicrobium sediminis TaxID=1478221 RepID=A0A267MDY1_9FIRM|nr:pyridoxamine 5'-phosphate oxidase family protein [Anaeromicrobium sediminis]PAB57128.1 pyridoxamine 5'-phosphate oxidase [Anaeromicrobium sediminis]